MFRRFFSLSPLQYLISLVPSHERVRANLRRTCFCFVWLQLFVELHYYVILTRLLCINRCISANFNVIWCCFFLFWPQRNNFIAVFKCSRCNKLLMALPPNQQECEKKAFWLNWWASIYWSHIYAKVFDAWLMKNIEYGNWSWTEKERQEKVWKNARLGWSQIKRWHI